MRVQNYTITRIATFRIFAKIGLNIKFYFSNLQRALPCPNHVIWRITRKTPRWRVGVRAIGRTHKRDSI